MVKNIYLDTKINLLRCQGADLPLEVALDHVGGGAVGVIGVGVLLALLKPVPINTAWSKTYIWTRKASLYNARELSNSLKWTWTMLL